jgi:hypothetical protein
VNKNDRLQFIVSREMVRRKSIDTVTIEGGYSAWKDYGNKKEG